MVKRGAKNVLLDYQRKNGYKKQGDALEDLLLKFNDGVTEAQKTGFLKTGAIIMIRALVTDGIIPADIIESKDLVAEEAIRRHNDPMSDPKPINTMVEVERDE